MKTFLLIGVMHAFNGRAGSPTALQPSLITVPETFINSLEMLLIVATGALVAVALNSPGKTK